MSAGLGTSPYTPVRFCCRPEVTLLTLVAAPTGGGHAGIGADDAAGHLGTVSRDWVDNAVRLIEADARRSAG